MKINRNKFLYKFALFVLFLLLILFQDQVNQIIFNRPIQPDENGLYYVSHVIDGDTIELANGKKVRYIGVDTPETVHPEKPVQCFGKEASSRNKLLVEGKKVRLESDVTEEDKYGRELRYVYLEDGTFVNLLLIKEGFALPLTIPPNVSHTSEFLQAKKEAEKGQVGLWNVNTCRGKVK